MIVPAWVFAAPVSTLTRRNAVDAALLFVIATVVLIAAMDRTIVAFDEGIVLVGAERVLAGDVIHRDFYSLYGPGQYYVLAALFKLFGTSVLVERVWDTAVKSLTVVLVYLIVLITSGRPIALAAAGCSVPWLACLLYYGYPMFPALAGALGCVLFLLPVLHGSPRRRWLWLSGLCAGITTLFRYDVGLFITVAAAVTLGPFVLRDAATLHHRLIRLMRVTLDFALGLGLITVPVAAAYLLCGVAEPFFTDVVLLPATTYRDMRGLPFPHAAAVGFMPLEAKVYTPLITCAAACFLLIRSWTWRASAVNRRERTGASQSFGWSLVLLTIATLALYSKGLVRVSIIHMGMGIISSLTTAAALAASWTWTGRSVRVVTATAILATLATTALAARITALAVFTNLAWAIHPDIEAHQLSSAPNRLGWFVVPDDERRALDYLGAVLRPGEQILVAGGRSDKVFVNNIALYLLADARPITHWHQFDPGLQTDRADPTTDRRRDRRAAATVHRA